MRGARAVISSLALSIALVCFSVAFLLSSEVLRGGSAAEWKEVGFMAIVVALLCGARP